MRRRSMLLARLRLRRRPILYWVVTVAVAVAPALLIGGMTARAQGARERYGGGGAVLLPPGAAPALLVGGRPARARAAGERYGGVRSVLVARRALAAGTTLRGGDVEMRPIPRAFVPAGALTSGADGRTVTEPIYAGEVVLADRV